MVPRPERGASQPAPSPAVTAYVNSLRFERGLAEQTVAAYRRDLLQLEDHLRRRGIALGSAQTDDLNEYFAAQTWRPATRARKMAAVRSFYRYLLLSGGLERDPSRRLTMSRPHEHLPKGLSVAQVERLLTRPPATPRGLRDRALLEILYGAGLRVSEAVGLRLQDVDFEVGFVRTIGKGDKERVVPLGRKAVEATLAYLQRGRPLLGPVGWPQTSPVAGQRARSAAVAPGGPPDRQEVRARGRPERRRVRPHASSLVRHPPAGGWRRSARRPGDARPRRRLHHPDLHPRVSRPSPPGVRGGSSPGQGSMSRFVILVLDGVGVGALPDADRYGDEGSNTLGNLSRYVPLRASSPGGAWAWQHSASAWRASRV